MVNMPPLMQQNPTPFSQSLIPFNDALNDFIVTTKCFLTARKGTLQLLFDICSRFARFCWKLNDLYDI